MDEGNENSVKNIASLIEVLVTEVLTCRAQFSSKHAQQLEKQLAKLKIIVQVPYFRTGLLTKIVQMMNAEISGLIEHFK